MYIRVCKSHGSQIYDNIVYLASPQTSQIFNVAGSRAYISSIGTRLFHVAKAALVLRATQESHTCYHHISWNVLYYRNWHDNC